MKKKRNTAPREVANMRFYSMIIEMRNDLAKGEITKSNMQINRYLNRFHIGKGPLNKISHLLFGEKPTFESCTETFEAIKRDHAASVRYKLRNNTTKTTEAENTQMPLSLFDTPQLTEEDAIRFLKERGYTITKQF